MGNAHFQLRTPGGGELPPVERPLLAGQVPRRRPAGGRRGVDALPRLLAETGRVGPERLRGEREPRGDRLSEADERTGPRAAPRRDHGGGGVDRLARGVATRTPP